MGSANALYFFVSMLSFLLYNVFLIFTLRKTKMRLDRSSFISLLIYFFYFGLSFANWIANVFANGSLADQDLGVHSTNDRVFRFFDLNFQFILILI